MNIVEVLEKGGPSIWLLVFLFVLLSFLALTTIIERIWFWSKILTREREVVARVLESARRDWNAAREVARRSLDQPIGRFLYAALELQSPDPEIFQLALQASADEELAAMRRGEKILEAIIAIAPLLGLLGTVLGLIRSLGSIRLGDLGTTSTEGVTLGISDALGSTAAGLIIAILSLAFYRIFQGLVLGQVKVFRQSGNELELLYRKDWAYRRNTGDMTSAPLSSAPGASVPGDRRLPKQGSTIAQSAWNQTSAPPAAAYPSPPSSRTPTQLPTAPNSTPSGQSEAKLNPPEKSSPANTTDETTAREQPTAPPSPDSNPSQS